MEARVSSRDILSQTLISIEHCVYLSKIFVWKSVYNDTEINCQSVSNVDFINFRIFTNTEYHKQTSFLYFPPTFLFRRIFENSSVTVLLPCLFRYVFLTFSQILLFLFYELIKINMNARYFKIEYNLHNKPTFRLPTACFLFI